MADVREIKNRMNSVRDTMKITNAMHMISTTKLKQAKRALNKTEPFFEELQKTMNDIIKRFPSAPYTFFEDEESKEISKRKICYLVITGDKGLAGAYNHNVCRLALEHMEKNGAEDSCFCTVGIFGYHFFSKKEHNLKKDFQFTASNPTLKKARLIADELVDMYLNRKSDEIYVIYTKNESAISSKTIIEKLLPLCRGDFEDSEAASELPIYPSAEEIVSALVPDYLTGFIFAALMESYTSEQNARVMAMESATRNAKIMLQEMSIVYNRLRQANITQEITEVVSGARAQKNKKKMKFKEGDNSLS